MPEDPDKHERLARRLFGRSAHKLDADEAAVLRGIATQTPISRDAGDIDEAAASFGDRLADRVAAVGGSWGFIIAFGAVLFSWMALNSGVLAPLGIAFDPYPYIFLNLMLSTLAAIQAPVIMMSQNRQATKDRLTATLDYQVNLRTELEILRIQEKIDQILVDRLDRILARLEDGAPLEDRPRLEDLPRSEDRPQDRDDPPP
jgi:uncharacterized membrane protein